MGVAVRGFFWNLDWFRTRTVWPREARVIEIQADTGNVPQPAMYYCPAEVEGAPLLVALHTWSGSYEQGLGASYARWCIKNQWAFLHPEFRGPNVRPEAGGSELAIQDVIRATAYATAQGRVDTQRRYLVGFSGGGHAALLVASRSPETWAGVSVWSPIVDLASWYRETVGTRYPYAAEIAMVCGGVPGPGTQAERECRQRSPLYTMRSPSGFPLDINAGIRDGHEGSVPVSHSIRLFNELAAPEDRVAPDELAYMVDVGEVPVRLRYAKRDPTYGDRRILFRRSSRAVRLTLFEGGHEIVPRAALSWLSAQRRASR